MTIRFTKGNHKPHTLTCVRDDGSSTWWPLPEHFLQHDMLHYIVETTLGFQNAFYGLIAEGRDITEFGTRQGRKDVYPDEAVAVEFIVGLLQVEMRGPAPPDNDSFFAMLALTCEKQNLPFLQSLTPEQLDAIRAASHAWSEQWEKLPVGKSMEVPFPAIPT